MKCCVFYIYISRDVQFHVLIAIQPYFRRVTAQLSLIVICVQGSSSLSLLLIQSYANYSLAKSEHWEIE